MKVKRDARMYSFNFRSVVASDLFNVNACVTAQRYCQMKTCLIQLKALSVTWRPRYWMKRSTAATLRPTRWPMSTRLPLFSGRLHAAVPSPVGCVCNHMVEQDTCNTEVVYLMFCCCYSVQTCI